MHPETVDLIDSDAALQAFVDQASGAHALAVDIETVNWWDRAAERVALIQLAFRTETGTRVAIIDTFVRLDLEPLRTLLESKSLLKVIHNASYDAIRLFHHYKINTAPIHDTMIAARRSGEKRWSLKAQVETHLGMQLDKREQRSDWSRRPLAKEQLRYAALDASCTLLLFERQSALGLTGQYTLRTSAPQIQGPLPLEPVIALEPLSGVSDVELLASAAALLGIVVELSGRYSPEQLSVSVGDDRVGLAGWIVDRMLGRDADIDEGSARLEIARLCEEGYVVINDTRRLEATKAGIARWSSSSIQLNQIVTSDE